MRRPDDLHRLPRLLHPAAWWLWGLGLATAASRTTNPFLLLLVVAVAGWVVMERREVGATDVFSAFLLIGLVAIGLRVVTAGAARRGGQRPGGPRPAARGAAAGVDRGRAPGRAGHPRGPARRGVRRAAAGRDPLLPGCRERAGQSPPAAALRARHPVRRRHGRRRGPHLRAADGAGRGARPGGPPAARPLQPGAALDGAAGRAGDGRRARPVAGAGRLDGVPWVRSGCAPHRRLPAGGQRDDGGRPARASCRPLRPARRLHPAGAGPAAGARRGGAGRVALSPAPGGRRGPATAGTPGRCRSGW